MAAKLKPRIPRFAYQGGKGKLATRIIPLLPPSGKRFVEPFAGRGNVYFRVAQRLDYKEFWLNDPYMFRFFEALQHSMDDGIEWVLPDRSQVDGEFYKLLRQKAEEHVKKEKPEWGASYDRIFRSEALPNGTKAWVLEQYPPLFVIECFLSRDGGTYKKGMKKPGDRKSVSKEGFMESVRLACKVMNRTKPRVTYYDWKDVLLELGPDDVVYFDPPYKDADVSYPDTLDHSELVAAVLKTWSGFKWVLSEYDHEIYRPLTEKFGEPLRIRVPKDMGYIRGGKREDAVECLWKNF